MKQITKKDIKRVLADRWWLGLTVANIFLAIVVVIAIALAIEPRETQVETQYSAFGIAGFYRGYWYTFWGYVLLELIVVASHIALSVKLQHLKRRDLSIALLILTLSLSVMILLFARSIIGVAALG